MTDKHTDTACDYCGQLIVENGHTYTNDILITSTHYDMDTGEPVKTMEGTSPLHTDVDYITICPDCEGPMFNAWNEMAEKLITIAQQRRDALRTRVQAVTEEYINEAEHQDGRAYWYQFNNNEEVLFDFALYFGNVLGDKS